MPRARVLLFEKREKEKKSEKKKTKQKLKKSEKRKKKSSKIQEQCVEVLKCQYLVENHLFDYHKVNFVDIIN